MCSGVYVVEVTKGIYVGESQDCFARNEYVDRLALEWGIVREMPGSTRAERRAAETEIADAWSARGFTVVSHNTAVARHATSKSIGIALRGKSCPWNSYRRSAATRAKMSAAMRGRKLSQEWRTKISAGLRGHHCSPETRAKISASRRKNAP